MPSDCLASTGGAPVAWISGGLVVLIVGLVLAWRGRAIAAVGLPLLFLAALSTSDSFQRPANALCSPDSSSILQGQLRIVSGVLDSHEVPVAVATNGTTSVTAKWGEPEVSGSDVLVAFAFPNVSPGQWSIDLTESPMTSFEFASSDLSIVVNSSRMLTGGPLNVSTSAPITVPSTGRHFEIAVTRS